MTIFEVIIKYISSIYSDKSAHLLQRRGYSLRYFIDVDVDVGRRDIDEDILQSHLLLDQVFVFLKLRNIHLHGHVA